MSTERGFSLIETLVALLIGLAMIVAVGKLGQKTISQRATSGANSVAAGIAERQLEHLLALPGPATHPDLAAGAHGPPGCVTPPCFVDVSGDASVSGPYLLRWDVTNHSSSATSPLVTPTSNSKRIIVTVTHANDAKVRARFVTYYKVS